MEPNKALNQCAGVLHQVALSVLVGLTCLRAAFIPVSHASARSVDDLVLEYSTWRWLL